MEVPQYAEIECKMPKDCGPLVPLCTSILADFVRPPSAEVCRKTTTSLK